MNRTELEKLKIKKLNEYKAKNSNHPGKEYAFSLDADSAAKLDFCLEVAGLTLADQLLTEANGKFDEAIHVYAHKNKLCDCHKNSPKSISDLLKMIME